MPPGRRPPPASVDELRIRAEALRGRTLGEIARALDVPLDGEPARTKGLFGQLVERALGASPLAGAGPDFPELGVELKTVPVDAAGAPRESTYVCALRVADADRLRWEDAPLRRKLSHVLFVPIEVGGDPEGRRVGEARFFRPVLAQEAILRSDFEHLVGLLGAYGPDAIDARAGRWLQVRPKAAHGRVRTLAIDGDGLPVETVPRGFYLRARVVGAWLVDPEAVPK